jgi:PhnB protein
MDDAEEMQSCFDALAEKGTVVEKIHDAFWGDAFGVVRDVYGVTWMFTCPKQTS